VVAALLGADEFGFGTVPLIALGCVMARQCHLNTCPVGIATQDPELRRKMAGTPDQVVAFLAFVAEQVRMILAELGLRSLAEAKGRNDLLHQSDSVGSAEWVDLSWLLEPAVAPAWAGGVAASPPHVGLEAGLDERLWADARAVTGPVRLSYAVTNRDRTVGARLSGDVAEQTSGAGLPPATFDVELSGTAGQSFGAFLVSGLRLVLLGEAQDYVGKGMSGGEIVIRPPRQASLVSHENVIAGNTILYGATGGTFFAAGRVGERFCVRNSGAEAVVEGCGDHGCEYMTGGVAVVLGGVGANFGAGMTGGVAYLWDGETVVDHPEHGRHSDDVRSRPLEDADARQLHELVLRHREATGSSHAATLLASWAATLRGFRKVVPAAAAAAAAEPRATASGS
jgi:glutamate synthase domain-containing protein 3